MSPYVCAMPACGLNRCHFITLHNALSCLNSEVAWHERPVLLMTAYIVAQDCLGSLIGLDPMSHLCSLPHHTQVVTAKATVISNTFLSTIQATITNTSSAKTPASTPTTTSLKVAAGCERESTGSLKLRFYVSKGNMTREVHGLPGARRRLQSTPCSATGGTSVGLFNSLCRTCHCAWHARFCSYVVQDSV